MGPETLDLYDRHRRPLNIEFVQQQTIANKRRMEEKDPVARKNNFEQLAAGRPAGAPRLSAAGFTDRQRKTACSAIILYAPNLKSPADVMSLSQPVDCDAQNILLNLFSCTYLASLPFLPPSHC
jgi:hypothetical protein